MSKRIYYKVVRVITFTGVLSSCTDSHLPRAVRYRVGEYVQPHKDAPPYLFVFDSLELADSFARRQLGLRRVYTCHIGRIRRQPKWVKNLQIHGTVLTEKVKLLERVSSWDF